MNKQTRKLVERMNDAFITSNTTWNAKEYNNFFRSVQRDVFEAIAQGKTITKNMVRGFIKTYQPNFETLIKRRVAVSSILADVNNVITNPNQPVPQEVDRLIKKSGGVKNRNKIASNANIEARNFANGFIISPYFRQNKKAINTMIREVRGATIFTSKKLNDSLASEMTKKFQTIFAASKDRETLIKFASKEFTSIPTARIERLVDTELHATQEQVQLLKNQIDGKSFKMWVNEGDSRVRKSHKIRQTWIPISGLFTLGSGAKAMFAGDTRLPPSERINCRCTTIYK